MRLRLYIRLFTAALMEGLHVSCSVDFRFIFKSNDVLMLVLGFTLISVYFVSKGNVFCYCLYVQLVYTELGVNNDGRQLIDGRSEM